MAIRHFFSSTIFAYSRSSGRAALLMLCMSLLIFAGCQDNSESGGGMPELPSAEIGQFNLLAQSPFPANIPVGTLPAQLLAALADSYSTGADIFDDWATAFRDCAAYSLSMEEPAYDMQTAQGIYQALAVASGNLGTALSAGNSAGGQAAAAAMAAALNDLADLAQEEGYAALATKLTAAATQANVLAVQIGQGLSTSEQLIAVFQADQAFRVALQAVADEVSSITTGVYLPMSARFTYLYYYIARTEYQEINATPSSATAWVLISPGHYRRSVTWNRTIADVEAETSYWTLWDALWNTNGFDYTELSRTITQTQNTTTQDLFSLSGTPSNALPPAYSRVVIQSRVITRHRLTGAIGGG